MLLALALVVRASRLNEPVTYDEAHTIRHYCMGGPGSVFLYSAPNNHVLHTIAVRFSFLAIGSGLFAARLPAFIAGLVGLYLLFVLAKRLNTPASGFISVFLMAISPVTIVYDCMARGYSLCTTLLLAMLIISPGVFSNGGCRRLFSVLAGLGLFVMPSYLLFMPGVYLWSFLTTPDRTTPGEYHPRFKAVFFSLVECGAVVVIAYSPVILATNGVELIIGNQFVQPLPLDDLFSALPAYLGSSAGRLVRTIPAWAVTILVSFSLAGCLGMLTGQRWPRTLLIPSILAGAFVVMLLKRVLPPERTWLPLLPMFFLLVEAGVLELRRWIRWCDHSVVHWSAALLLAWWSLTWANCDQTHLMADIGAFTEAKSVSVFLQARLNDRDRVIARVPADEPLYYCLGYPLKKGLEPERDLSSRTFFVTKPSRYNIQDLTKKGAILIMKSGDAEVYITDEATTPSQH